MNIDLGLGTWGPAWPFLTGLDAGLFVRSRSREVDLAGRLYAESLVGSGLMIPIDCASPFGSVERLFALAEKPENSCSENNFASILATRDARAR